MPVPLLALALGSAGVGFGANLYSQYKQRELYRYQRAGYERALADYNKRNPTRPIRYPELSYPGHIRALDVGISQSYASSVGSIARFTGIGSASGYRKSSADSYRMGFNRARSLFGQSAGRSSRYL